MNVSEIVEYEVRASSWWTGWFPFNALASKYFAWKVERKWRRYQYSLMEAAEVAARRAANRTDPQ